MSAAGPSRAYRRLLDESRRTRTMVWIMGVMVFLTALAAALGLGMATAGRTLDGQLAGRVTVQLVVADADARTRQAEAALAALRADPAVRRAVIVPPAEIARLLQPWLGEGGLDADLPVPAMIDMELAPGADAAALERRLRAVAPSARLEGARAWLGPVSGFLSMLTWLGGATVMLLALATGAVVVLAARSGLDTHRPTIEVMHMLGATDVQVARLFQRRIAVDTLLGGVGGTVLATGVILLIGLQIQRLGSEMLANAALGPGDWLAIFVIPLLFALLAMLAARLSVLSALRRTL
jgi:cell division transport system permease protein